MEPNNPLPPQAPEPEPDYRPQVFMHRSGRKKWWVIGILLVLALIAAGYVWKTRADDQSKKADQPTNRQTVNSEETPKIETTTVLEGRNFVWDLGFLPTGEMLFTERNNGTVSVLDNNKARELKQIEDVVANGEGGLLGLAVDPLFADNRYIYTCFNTATDIRVVRWTVKSDVSDLEKRTDIISGIPRNPSGRHSGCRLAFGPDEYLWVGTGDTAQNLTPQSPQAPKSLAGKILRVDRDGKAAEGNMSGDFDSRIYSYGHRNTQGIAFFAEPIGGVPGISVEHGSGVDDEMNPLKPGNFGWAPPDGPYDESVPMTDKDRFPDAVEAIWSSGNPTQAPSGVAVLKGEQWKGWNGAMAMAMLKDEHLKILLLDDKLAITHEEGLLKEEFGRLRAAVQAPDGSLYLTTSNGDNQDKIIKVTPK